MGVPIDVTVAAVIEQDDKFLIIEERVRERRVYNQPAGHIEPGESLQAAVIRETFEETGYQFSPTDLIGIFLWQRPKRTYLRLAFSGVSRAPSSTPTLDAGIIATHWLSRATLEQRSSMLRSPMVMQCIDNYQAGISYPLDAITTTLANFDTIANIA